MVALSVLNGILNIVQMSRDSAEMCAALQGACMPVIGHILQSPGYTNEFVEEMLSLVMLLTTKGLDENMWQVFAMIYARFKEDCVDLFVEMCPVVHNVIRHGLNAPGCPPEAVGLLFDMCKTVWESPHVGEDDRWHAAKMMQCMLTWAGAAADLVSPDDHVFDVR